MQPQMFICPFTKLFYKTKPATRRRINNLAALSKSCLNLGLHPAQGLRVHKQYRKPPYIFRWQKVVIPTPQMQAHTAFNRIKQHDELYILPAHTLKPDHFLLNTSLP